ncbi:MAG: hypothetical protein J6D22_01960 [Pyramidobacter sp.]|nr:hypothetical protein [Pyramidobacter sp.]
MKESLRAQYGENKRLTAGDYDASLAVSPSLRAENSPDGKTKVRPLYDGEKREVMVFDEFNVHPEKESERKIIDWERTYFLTEYYCI